jgi:monoamine oxidase
MVALCADPAGAAVYGRAMDERRSVVVIGAGLAGLTAARALRDAGVDVVVHEARDRVGGRTLTQDVRGAAVDLGAQWIGPAQHRMHGLARRFGLATFETFTEGKAVVVDGADVTAYAGTVPLLGPVQLARMGAALVKLRTLSFASDRGRAITDDALEDTLAAWLGDGSARRVVDQAIRVIFGEEPTAVPLDWCAAYAAAAGGDLLDLAAIEGGAQQTRLVGGTQAVAVALAEGLDVVLERPVGRVARDADGVTVTSLDRAHTVRADRVIIAVPRPAAVLEHDPPMPEPVRRVSAGGRMGATTKVVAVYDSPFWRAAGWRGEAVLTDGPVQVTFDNTSHDGAVPSLLAFVTGDAARAASDRPDDELTEAVIASLVRAFGPNAAAPTQVVQHHWTRERWSEGCPVANPGVGVGADRVALRRPVGRVHLAWTETATEWTGYMEGAVQSGERAAAEVLAAL